jgi:hypothetical protein
LSKMPVANYEGYTFTTKPFDPTTTLVFDRNCEWVGSITAGVFTPAISEAETNALLADALRKSSRE